MPDCVATLDRLEQGGRVVPEIARPEYREILFKPYQIIYGIDATRTVTLTLRNGGRMLDAAEVDEGVERSLTAVIELPIPGVTSMFRAEVRRPVLPQSSAVRESGRAQHLGDVALMRPRDRKCRSHFAPARTEDGQQLLRPRAVPRISSTTRPAGLPENAAFPLAPVLAADTRADVKVLSVLRPFFMPMYMLDPTPIPLNIDQEVRAVRKSEIMDQITRVGSAGTT